MALWTGGGWGKGRYMCTQRHLYEQYAHLPATHANGSPVDVLARCSASGDPHAHAHVHLLFSEPGCKYVTAH